jgi:hypothetical protein
VCATAVCVRCVCVCVCDVLAKDYHNSFPFVRTGLFVRFSVRLACSLALLGIFLLYFGDVLL